jgi:HAD superfamily hydrolase (TIGR01549 family)
MGGDQLVSALCGDEVEREWGDDIRATETDRYFAIIDEVRPLEGARGLIEDLKGKGHEVVLASSAKPQEVEHYLDLLDARELADAWTSSGDVEATKPHPDLIHAALDRIRADRALMIGDSTWDCRAARNAGVETLAVLTGGFSAQELYDAGALSVFDSLAELRERLPGTALG